MNEQSVSHRRLLLGLFFAWTLGGTSLAGQLYYSELITGSTNGVIRRSALDGSNVVTLIQTESPTAVELDLQGRKIYYVTHDDGLTRLRRANLDGSGQEELLLAPVITGFDLDLSAGKVYYSVLGPKGGGLVVRVNLDGSDLEYPIISTRLALSDVALDLQADKFYLTDLEGWGIYRANLDGSDLELVLQSPASPLQLALDIDDGRAYWTSWEGLFRGNLDGTGIEKILPTEFQLFAVAIDPIGDKVYVSQAAGVNEPEQRQILRANLDGSNVEVLHVNVESQGLAVDPFDTNLVPATSGLAALALTALMALAAACMLLRRSSRTRPGGSSKSAEIASASAASALSSMNRAG